MDHEDDDTRGGAPRGRADGAPARNAPAPLGQERIIRWLEQEEYVYFVDSEGDIGGLWDERPVYFYVLGERDEILQVRGMWNRSVALAHLPEVLAATNRWNHDRIFPKAYAQVRDDGAVRIVAEHTVDLEHGVSDAQLAQMLSCALGTIGSMLDDLDRTFPDPFAPAQDL